MDKCSECFTPVLVNAENHNYVFGGMILCNKCFRDLIKGLTTGQLCDVASVLVPRTGITHK